MLRTRLLSFQTERLAYFLFWFGGGKIAGRRCDLRREDMPSGSHRGILVGGSAEQVGPAQARALGDPMRGATPVAGRCI